MEDETSLLPLLNISHIPNILNTSKIPKHPILTNIAKRCQTSNTFFESVLALHLTLSKKVKESVRSDVSSYTFKESVRSDVKAMFHHRFVNRRNV